MFTSEPFSTLAVYETASTSSSGGICPQEVNDKVKASGDAIATIATRFSHVVIPLVSIGIVTNLILSVLIVRQMCFGGSVKRYLFLLSRAVVDFYTCLSVLIVVAHRRKHPSGSTVFKNGSKVSIPYGSSYLNGCVQFNFWSLCITYALLSLITFIAIRFPFFYRSRMNARLCIIILLISMILGGCYSGVSVYLGSTPFITLEYEDPQSLSSYSPLDNKAKAFNVAIGDVVVILLLWIFVFALYVVVLVLLIKLRRQDMIYRTYLKRSLRMSFSIVLWTILCAFMVAAVISPPLWNLRSREFKDDSLENLCMALASVTSSLKGLVEISTVAESVWLARFVFDPFVCICMDADLREFCSTGIKRIGTFHYSVQRSSS